MKVISVCSESDLGWVFLCYGLGKTLGLKNLDAVPIKESK